MANTAGHGVDIGDLADRMSINLTMLLTIVAFKWAGLEAARSAVLATAANWRTARCWQ